MDEEKKDKEWFQKLGLPSLVYALVFTFCMFENLTGITMPIWIGATIFYACFVMKNLKMTVKKDSICSIAVMLLLGIATVLTDNVYLILMNYAGFFLMLITFLLHNFYEDREWGMAKSLLEITAAVGGAIMCIGAPFVEAYAAWKEGKKEKNPVTSAIGIGLLIAIPCVGILTLLLGSADAVFGAILENLLENLVVSDRFVGMVCFLAFGFFASYCGMRYLAKKSRPEQTLSGKEYDPIVAITITTIITILYFFFCVVQIKYLFLGQGTLPDGMTYAQYARTGFFQLLFVAVFNFFYVLGITYYFKRKTSLIWLLRIFCGCTFLMIGSSAYRMLLYIDAYQLTFLRIFVLVALFVITLLMAGVLILLAGKNISMSRYTIGVISVCYLIFAFSGVDARIASYNLEHMTQATKQDTLEYIGTLSTDAASVIETYVDQDSEMRAKIEAVYGNEKTLDSDWIYTADSDISWYLSYRYTTQFKVKKINLRNFNLSHYLAAQVM